MHIMHRQSSIVTNSEQKLNIRYCYEHIYIVNDCSFWKKANIKKPRPWVLLIIITNTYI